MTVGDPARGALGLELYFEPGGSGDRISQATAEDGDASTAAMLFAGDPHLARASARPLEGWNDNCYEITFKVVGPGVRPDAYERNDSLETAARLEGEWSHRHHDPTIFEDGAERPGDGLLPELRRNWGSAESWTFTVRDLTIHSRTDRDFFRIAIPDPADPAGGGHPVFVSACGETKRRGFLAGTTDTVSWRARLGVAAYADAVPGGPGERVTLYPAGAGDSILFCPRSRHGLTELVFSVGEGADPSRRVAQSYHIEISCTISITRLEEAIPFEPFVLPCPGGFHPRCDEELLEGRRGRILMEHPYEVSDPDCLVDGCPDEFLIAWDVREDLDMIFEATAELSYRLFELAGGLIGEALPFGGTPGGGGVVEAGPVSRRLFIPDLEPGSYVLVVAGPEAAYTIDCLVPEFTRGRPPARFIRGDVNGDGSVTGEVTDAVFLLQWNFAGGGEPPCLAACDSNGDGEIIGQVTDAVHLLRFNFLGAPQPPPPFPGCGEGPFSSDEALGCERTPSGCPSPVPVLAHGFPGLGAAPLLAPPLPRSRRRDRKDPSRPRGMGPALACHPTGSRASCGSLVAPEPRRRRGRLLGRSTPPGGDLAGPRGELGPVGRGVWIQVRSPTGSRIQSRRSIGKTPRVRLRS